AILLPGLLALLALPLLLDAGLSRLRLRREGPLPELALLPGLDLLLGLEGFLPLGRNPELLGLLRLHLRILRRRHRHGALSRRVLIDADEEPLGQHMVL